MSTDYIVDERHAAGVEGRSWRPHYKNGYFQSSRKVGGKTICDLLHRKVWELEYCRLPSDGLSIDHINGVKSDCRIANLRPASRKLQNLNRTRPRASGLPRGVDRAGRCVSRPYRATLRIERSESGHIGYFATAEEASAAYESALAAAIEAEAKKCWEMFWNQKEEVNERAA